MHRASISPAAFKPMSAMKPLTIYKASAGSGKTFRLAVEYITLVVKEPENYKSILAVTFTNKATAEMKLRILSQLYGIARALPSSDDYLKEVRQNVSFSDKEIRQRAATALTLLTHNYNYFRVQTIDAFFQTVLRNLARELNLTANLRISLNDNDIEAMAVDEMIQGLQPGAQVLQWIGDYIQSNMDENRGWNVFGQIKKFGENIFREFYQTHRESLNDRLSAEGFFENFRKSLIAERDNALHECLKPYRAMVELLQREGLDDESLFAGTSNELSYYKKVLDFDNLSSKDRNAFLYEEVNKTRQVRMDDPQKWIRKCEDKKNPEVKRLLELVESQLREMLCEADANRLKQGGRYLSARLTLAHLNQLRLLRAIEKAVDNQNIDNNRFLLSNTQHLLNTMIDGSDTPFIFEKIGAQLHHIMIDEFQDTSTVQWKNFWVLLANCLAQRGSRSLIVGDVKQSIYRWRSGDWKLLNGFCEDALTHIEQMTVNYRSSHRVINFNNAFFVEAAAIERAALEADRIKDAQQLAKAYDDVEQEAKKSELPGRVEVRLIKQEGASKADYKAEQLDTLASYVCKMIDVGVKTSDIAILVRVNSAIRDIADFFAHDERLCERGIRLVSDEAFRLDASVAVRLLVNALQVLSHPDDALARAALVKNYQTYVLCSGLTDAQLLMDTPEQYLPEVFVCEKENLVAMPLLDLVERLYKIFSLARVEGQTAYVCAFHDLLAEYLEDHDADIDQLLTYWEETLCKKTIQSDDVDGIRILSIHKSKGLEYAHVLVPFCDWKLEQDGTLWCQKERPAPYDALPIIPVDYSSALLHTVYAEDYREEHFQNTVDNLNLLYVAFTRAGKSLTVIGKKGAEKNSRSVLVEEVVRNLAKKENTDAALYEDDAMLVFEYGDSLEQIVAWKPEYKKKKDNVFEQKPETCLVGVETFEQQAEFRQSNRSRDFVSNDEPSPRESYIQRGNVLHEIFSHIHTLDDVEPAIAQLTIDGVLANDEQSLNDLRAQVAQCLAQPQVREWFSPRWTLYNECTILTCNEQGRTIEHRPDRVMTDGAQTVVVDFKFGRPRAEYREQVLGYAHLLSEMGMTDVKAYLWYVTLGQVEEVVVS